MSRDRATALQPGQQSKTPSQKKKEVIVVATQGAKAEGTLEARDSKLPCTMIMPVNHHCTLAWGTQQGPISTKNKTKSAGQCRVCL